VIFCQPLFPPTRSMTGSRSSAKGFVERLLDIGARVAIVDPLGVWWELRASADGSAAGYPVVVFGGRHADVPITAEMGPALGRLIAVRRLSASSIFPSSAATRRAVGSWRRFPKRFTRRTRSRCTSLAAVARPYEDETPALSQKLVPSNYSMPWISFGFPAPSPRLRRGAPSSVT
jgi:hypothetical protein